MDSLRLCTVSSGETQIISQTKNKMRKLSLSSAGNSMRFLSGDRRTKKAKYSKGKKNKKLDNHNKKMKNTFNTIRKKMNEQH